MLVGLLIGLIGFQFILEQVNKIELKVISDLHERIRSFKNKTKIQYASMIISAGILWAIMDGVGIRGILQGLVIGILWASLMFVFEDTIFDNMRNTLR